MQPLEEAVELPDVVTAGFRGHGAFASLGRGTLAKVAEDSVQAAVIKG